MRCQVRVWHDNGEASTKQPELVTGFCAMPELVTSAVGPGLVMQWQPGPGHLVAAGASRDSDGRALHGRVVARVAGLTFDAPVPLCWR